MKKLLKLLEAKNKLVDLVQIDKKSNQIKDLFDKCKKKTWINSTINHSISLSKSAFQLSLTIFISMIHFSKADFWAVDKKIN